MYSIRTIPMIENLNRVIGLEISDGGMNHKCGKSILFPFGILRENRKKRNKKNKKKNKKIFLLTCVRIHGEATVNLNDGVSK